MMTRTKAPQRIIAAVAIAIAAFPAPRLDAATLSSGDAVGLAAEWLGAPDAAAHSATRRSAASGGGRQRARMRPSGAPSGAVRTCSIGGTNLFHLVALEGGGFVAVPADDSMTPILGFSTSGGLPDENPANPFWALVGADAEAAITGRRRSERASRAYAFEEVVATPNTRTAARTTRAAATNPIEDDSGIDDLRVAPLVKSQWSQGYVDAKAVYNYYTPSNYYCGCIATAMAQLMRHHEFPREYVAPQSFTCYLADNLREENIRECKLGMIGGVYDWQSMPLTNSTAVTPTIQQEIGKICYDAGVATRMLYSPEGSGTFTYFSHDALRSVFGYASAQSYYKDCYELGRGYCMDYTNSISIDKIQNAILSNLDADYPALLGIYGTGGHAVLADGYGYVDETLYCHLNMGWDGADDYWYAIPVINPKTNKWYTFTALNAAVYNVFPDRTAELATGRVINSSGEPVSNATVTATITYRSGGQTHTSTTNVVSSSSGHFAIFAPAGVACDISLSAASHGMATTNSVTARTTASLSPSNLTDQNWAYGFLSSHIEMNIGNSWGNDLYLAPTNKPFTLVFGW